MEYIWKKATTPDLEVIKRYPELHPIVAQLLHNRGLDAQAAVDEFLNPDYGEDIHDPFLFSQMQAACQRIRQAIERKELITIFADYDADGVSAAVILHSVLTRLGANFSTYIPHREKEGYGLNKKAVEEIGKSGCKLMITCDCGISNFEEVKLVNQLGMEVIITDHHSVPEQLPPALVLIHAQIPGEKYPYKYLAGGGVAFKLAQALLRDPENKTLDTKQKEVEEKWLLDMVAVSTVADMVPLLGENRTLLKYGLIVLKKAMRPGMRAMIDVASLEKEKLDARSIAFAIAPRINAAGRMDHANLAFYLLIEQDPAKAGELARQLNQSNTERQRLTEQIVNQAKSQTIDKQEKILFFYDEKWNAGLNGLVASRLVRDFYKPCFVLTRNDDVIIGSGRSVAGFDVTAALAHNRELLLRFGGHPQACGFACSPDKMPELIANIQKLGRETLKDSDLQAELDIELAIDFEEISWDMVDIVQSFQPFGQANPEPLFVSENVQVVSARKIGSNQNHWKLVLKKGQKQLGAVAFGLADKDVELGKNMDLVYNLTINQWNGNREVQLIIRDFKTHA